jgi:hypothetical protein
LHAGKRLENRSWKTEYRGPVLLHASKWWDAVEVLETVRDIIEQRELLGFSRPLGPLTLRMLQEHYCGQIVGRAEIVGCISEGDKLPAEQGMWWIGPYAFVLDKVEPLARPIPYKGALGFFDVPDALVAGVLR